MSFIFLKWYIIIYTSQLHFHSFCKIIVLKYNIVRYLLCASEIVAIIIPLSPMKQSLKR